MNRGAWNLLRGTAVTGPFPEASLQEMATNGQLGAQDLISFVGTDQWVRAGDVPQLVFRELAVEKTQSAMAEQASANTVLPLVLACSLFGAILGLSFAAAAIDVSFRSFARMLVNNEGFAKTISKRFEEDEKSLSEVREKRVRELREELEKRGASSEYLQSEEYRQLEGKVLQEVDKSIQKLNEEMQKLRDPEKSSSRVYNFLYEETSSWLWGGYALFFVAGGYVGGRIGNRLGLPNGVSKR